MNLLTPKLKNHIYKKWVFGRYRRYAKPVYDAVITAELAGYRLLSWVRSVDHPDPSKLTIIIKTFERADALSRLVTSIQRRYPTLPIVVVDDSQEPKPVAGVKTIIMPFDSGISAGRNRALDEIDTPYFLLLDDDFIFSYHQQLEPLIALMEQNREIDIIGGRCIDLPLLIQHRFQNSPLHPTDAAPKTPLGTTYACGAQTCTVVDKVQNYFVGRTETIRQVKWNPALKVQEHTEFFTRARGQLTTVFHPTMRVVHAKTPFNLAYMVMRYRG